ncbi:MAG TPA: GMC family oxidoreductase [Gemmatimonadales bacterium]|nr:GMC family oxidoreductase [Gemmatimonadales bacterium]
MSTYDAVIIGSGFGGTMAAHTLVHAGLRVLMLERGAWVRRGPHNWTGDEAGMLGEHYATESPYLVYDERGGSTVGAFSCVGGPSVFYGGVALRFRSEDFESNPDLDGNSGAAWPYSYEDLEPYYTAAERIIGVAGESGQDPTEPSRSAPYLEPAAPLAATSERIARAARDLGFHPFRLPLAINYGAAKQRNRCVACGTCDGFACAISAKNDLATSVLPDLVERGLELRTQQVAIRIMAERGRVTGIVCADGRTGERTIYRGERVVLAAGALGSPHLILASRLQRSNPGGHVVGRYLMRHLNRIAFGVFSREPAADGGIQKQIGIHDLYFGDAASKSLRGKLGGIQQVGTPPAALVRQQLAGPLGEVGARLVGHLVGLLTIAEDQPQFDNRVVLDRQTDRFGVPRLVISHRYTKRDIAASRLLMQSARAVLRRAGAWACYQHQVRTFSHAVGTVRMGRDPRTSALDEFGRFRGIDNLFVLDGSFMPRSGGVNPSLTIAANALRAAAFLVRSTPRQRVRHAYIAR